jgi:acetolactate synthase small subunit
LKPAFFMAFISPCFFMLRYYTSALFLRLPGILSAVRGTFNRRKYAAGTQKVCSGPQELVSCLFRDAEVNYQ